MKYRYLVGLFFLGLIPFTPYLVGQFGSGSVLIMGGTDNAIVGNNSDRLKVDASGTVRFTNTAITVSQGTTPWAETGTVQFTNTSIAVSSLPPVTGTVSFTNTAIIANIGTTGGLALDSTLDNLTITPGAAVGANTGALVQAVATTTAPAYSTATINPLSLTTVGALRVDASSTTQGISFPVSTVTDLASAARTTSGNTSWIDALGYGEMSIFINVTAVSGTTPTMNVEIQSSDDASTPTVLYDSQTFTTTGNQRFPGVRISGRYYRYTWSVAGTTPSFTFSIITTLKAYSSARNVGLIRYNDLNLTILNNVSTTFSAQTCANISLMLVRGALGATANFVIDGSNDNVNFGALTSSQIVAASSTVVVNLTGQAFAYYRARTSNVSVSAGATDLYWRCNGGS